MNSTEGSPSMVTHKGLLGIVERHGCEGLAQKNLHDHKIAGPAAGMCLCEPLMNEVGLVHINLLFSASHWSS